MQVDEQTLIIFYNPQCAKPNYQRMPAAILQVASLIEGRFSYEIVDGNLRSEVSHAQQIVDKVHHKGVKYLAISIMPGPQLVSTLKDLRIIKKHCPELTVIVGGYFPLNHYQVCANDRDIDYVIVGPGERSFRDLIVALETGSLPETVSGIAFERNGELVTTNRSHPMNPNHLPRYPYHRINVEDYVLPTFLGSRTLSHHSSFGCPFFCNFCAVVSLADGKWIGETGERLGELAQYMVNKWQINALEFHDNNFFTAEKRVKEFCNQLISRNLKISWWGEGRADTLLKYKDETWRLMRDCGLKMVFLGAESGDDETLRRMNKGGKQSASGVLKLVKKMKDFDIIPELSFILGNPPNPVKDMKKSIKFIRKIKKLNPSAEIIMYRYDPVPVGGEMFDQVTKLGFSFPTSLEEWVDPKWRKIQKRTTADVPWLTEKEQIFLAEFQTVLNAYYPTSTARHIKPGSWRYWLLKLVSGFRYHGHFYFRPYELNWLQQKLSYQRPEISGF
ncbi:B12-binding domain-containing radical SAM protein [Aliikangiella coralliicola]|uniref:B12-binding domain-containing radical SAM protein n=1 Tax=Aliikangiella coralliicola TaxID=2592383 RepID=A0A545UJ66_9GAMM|nr:radical SAM protein [Aliikangiella coralliicola]TQV89507.1 B12-binding domain-containing radical SAM protein [Aliikangiella coralliicola]